VSYSNGMIIRDTWFLSFGKYLISFLNIFPKLLESRGTS
jgi:hypothetical protein